MAVQPLLNPRFDGRVIRRREARDWGLTPHDLDRLVRSGAVVYLVRGLYADAAAADDLLLRSQAVAMALPRGAAVCRRTAAWLMSIDPRRPDERGAVLDIECCVPVGRMSLRRPGVRCFVADLTPADLCTIGSVPFTTPERTVMDLARWLPPHMGLACFDAMAGRGLVDPARLAVSIERWHGERFVGQARYLIKHCEPRTESYGESWLRLRVVDAGFPRSQPQIWVEGDGVPVYRLDMGWRSRRIGLEYDGEEFHSSQAAREHDEARREELRRRFGWTVIGVGRGEVLGRGLALEHAVGGLLGKEPTIRVRRW